jgi:Secretion system C-terminal sorting domain/Cleaved Adhesin Domain
MATFLRLFLLLLGSVSLAAQSPEQFISDTLLRENFEQDPTDNMLPFPTGNDQAWVNFDADGLESLCVDGSDTPGAWYYESDLGESSGTPNWAFTSCSFSEFSIGPSGQNSANWLILPPILVPDTNTVLQWRSLALQGPMYVDGYHVLVSTTDNDALNGSFSDTIFSAAETLFSPNDNYSTLLLSNYVFSPGYIHANAYTNPNYFFSIDQGGGPFYHGRMEPHEVSLAAFAGQNIFIAFLHDSDNDFLLQIDDILVVDREVSGVQTPADLRAFSVQPNPTDGLAQVRWAFDKPQECRVTVRDLTGRVAEQVEVAGADSTLDVDLSRYPTGVYVVTLQTASGVATRRLVRSE